MKKLDKPKFIGSILTPEGDLCYRVSGSITGPIRVAVLEVKNSLRMIVRFSRIKLRFFSGKIR